MNIVNHGAWKLYIPAEFPADAPPNAIFARRDGDDMDWYAYVRGKHFAPHTVKMTLHNNVVGAATTDETRLFPAGATVLETDPVTGDPQAMFGGKFYDAATKTFHAPQPPQEQPKDEPQ